MNVLDENIPASQRQLLENWRIRPRQIGFNIGRRGLQDDEIIVFLQQLRRPTFSRVMTTFTTNSWYTANMPWSIWPSKSTR